MTERKLRKRLVYGLMSGLLTLTIMGGVWPIGIVSAAQLSSRTLTLSSSANGTISTDIAGNVQTAGTGGNGAKTAETFQFSLATTGNVGSMSFVYCTTPIAQTTCTTPTGLTVQNVASVQTQKLNGSNIVSNPYVLDTTTANAAVPGCNGAGSTRTNCILINRSPTVSQNASDTFLFTFGGQTNDYITNPTTDNTTFFVRVTTYSDTAYTTTSDSGTVASSTAQQIDITAKVQETLNFSVGSTVTAPGGNCTPFSDNGALNLGDINGVLSSTQAYTAHSYFRVSTNAVHGLVVQYSGHTLTNGSFTIAAIGPTSAASAPGTSQFGIDIDSNDTQGGSGYSFTYLTTGAQYSNTAKWAFDTTSVNTPVSLASSSGVIVCDTGSVSYLGNIAYSTPAGIYTTTITYIAVPTY